MLKRIHFLIPDLKHRDQDDVVKNGR